MKLAVVGMGNAGSKVTDRLLEFEADTGRSLVSSVLAINSASVDLARLSYVPSENRLLLGQTNQKVKGHGAGGDPDLGATVTRADMAEIERSMDGIPVHEIDGFLVVAGLGGGTGSGGAPVLARRLGEIYDEPVFGLGIIPGTDEGGRASLNAARSLQSFADATDNLIAFDNDAWRGTTDSLSAGYERTNWELARRIVTLLAAGEMDGSRISETAMDSSDIRRTLATGGISTVAYSEAPIEESTREQRSLLGRLSMNGDAGQSEGELATKVHGLVRKAVQSRLTCPAEVASAERSLIVISGPPEELSRKGLERSRKWLEEVTGSAETMAGDDPRDGAQALSAVVLLSNVTDVPRIDALQQQAVTAQENIDEQAHDRESEIEELVTDERGDLDPIT